MDVRLLLFLLTLVAGASGAAHPNATIYLNVDRSDSGNKIKLTCDYQYNKRGNRLFAPTIYWFRNGEQKDVGDGPPKQLKFVATYQDIGAVYTCVVVKYDDSANEYVNAASWILDIEPKGTSPGPTATTIRGSTATDGEGITPQSSNSADVIQAVTLTFIFVLVVAVVVLGFFFIRMKRRVQGKQPESAQQMNEYESDPPPSAPPPDDFNEYAHIGRVHQSNDEYRSFDYGHSVHGHANAAFERDSADYTEYEADGTPLDRDPQGRLEDGYEGKGRGETPEYMDLEQEATNPASSYENSDQQGEEPGYSLEGAVASPLGGAGDVDDYEYSTPENVENGYSLVEAPNPTPEDADDYSQPYSHPQTAGSKMAAGTKMAARGWHGNAPSGDEDDYNRLDHPNLKKPW